MSKQVQEAYRVAATRTPWARHHGDVSQYPPDDLLAHVLRSVLAQCLHLILRDQRCDRRLRDA